jgi:anti-sigma factor RsiW
VEPAERLTAYLAGDLSADEREAFEAELARDADLRADVEAARRADVALAAQPPTPLPDGARDRLLAALEPTLTAELGPRPDATAVTDELAARRTATARRSWITAVGGIAAAVAAVAVIGPALGGLGAGDIAETDVASDAMLESTEDGGEDAAGSAPAVPVGPTLLGSDRAIDEEGAAGLLRAGEVEAVVAQGLTPDEAQALGDAWAQAFGADAGRLRSLEDGGTAFDATAESGGESAAADGAEEASPAEAANDGAAVEEDLEEERAAASDAVPSVVADLQILGDVDEAAREDVARCLGQVLGPSTLAVPVFAELVTFEGEPAVAFALVTPDPDGDVTRREVWVLAREDCQMLYWQQG